MPFSNLNQYTTYRLLFAFFILCLLIMNSGIVFTQSPPNEWPSWRGPQYDMSASLPDIDGLKQPTLKVVWKKKIGSAYSPVSVAEGTAVTLFADGENDWIIAFDATTGAELWRSVLDSTYIGHDGSHDGPIAAAAVGNGLAFAISPWGELAAFDLKDGKRRWRKHLQSDFEGLKPWYGFSAAPLLAGELLVVQTGGPNGKAISAFDSRTGNIRWQVGSDTLTYQSPMMVTLNGVEQLVAVTNRNLVGLATESGDELWRFDYQGDASPIGGGCLNPAYLDDGRFLLQNKVNSTAMFSLETSEAGATGTELWSTDRIKRTYNAPVYVNGLVIGFNSRILTALDPDSGKQVWRSRPPGDGFLSVLDNHLVSVSKKGHLAIAKVDQEGYHEIDRLDLLEGNSWSPASFAYGKIYARGFGEIACVEVVEGSGGIVARTEPVVGASPFVGFLNSIAKAEDQQQYVEAFISGQKEFPIIEGNKVHFVYRGGAADVAIIGDLIGDRFEQRMTKIEGTDLFYHTAEALPDARLDYAYIVDFENRQIDSLNSRHRETVFGPASWFAMPGWKPAAYLESGIKEKGTIDTVAFESEFAENRRIDIYLPPGYANGDDRYPVIYMHWGDKAQEWGELPVILDNLIGNRLQPVIVVFIPQIEGFRSREWSGGLKEGYAQMVAEELVPYIDEHYRTIAQRDQRLNIGMGFAGYAAIYGTFKYPAVFSKLGSQSAFMITYQENQLKETISSAEKQPLEILMEWASYDYRSEVEGWGAALANKSLVAFMQEQGYQPRTNLVNMGFGWGSWQHRTGDILIHFFPIAGK